MPTWHLETHRLAHSRLVLEAHTAWDPWGPVLCHLTLCPARAEPRPQKVCALPHGSRQVLWVPTILSPSASSPATQTQTGSSKCLQSGGPQRSTSAPSVQPPPGWAVSKLGGAHRHCLPRPRPPHEALPFLVCGAWQPHYLHLQAGSTPAAVAPGAGHTWSSQGGLTPVGGRETNQLL